MTQETSRAGAWWGAARVLASCPHAVLLLLGSEASSPVSTAEDHSQLLSCESQVLESCEAPKVLACLPVASGQKGQNMPQTGMESSNTIMHPAVEATEMMHLEPSFSILNKPCLTPTSGFLTPLLVTD